MTHKSSIKTIRDPRVLTDRKTCDLLYAALYNIAENINPDQYKLDLRWTMSFAYEIAQDALRKATNRNPRYHKLENKYHD